MCQNGNCRTKGDGGGGGEGGKKWKNCWSVGKKRKREKGKERREGGRKEGMA